MDKAEAQGFFERADKMYRMGRYREALDLLDRLDQAYPNTRHVMFPRARCLAKVGRVGEAVAICNVLATEHAYKPAVHLRDSLTADANAPAPASQDHGEMSLEALGLTVEEDLPSAFGRQPAIEAQGGGVPWLSGIIAAAAVIALSAAAYLFFTRESADTSATARSGGPPVIDASGPPELITLRRSASQDGVTVNTSIEYGIWTDCGDYDCFLQKFAACEPAAIRMVTMGTFEVEFHVLGMRGGSCWLEVEFRDNPIFETWNGKTMTCPCDSSMDFITVTETVAGPEAILNGTFQCTGPLADAMRATYEAYM